MKKALHDALGYLWVKNSLEADKKRKQEIANENDRIQIAADRRKYFLFGVKWWGTTELGYAGLGLSGFPDELRWYPKDEFIKAFKIQPKAGYYCGAWWNPKWGDMKDYFSEEELKTIRFGFEDLIRHRYPNDFPRLTPEQEQQRALEISCGTMPRTEFNQK